MILKSTKGQSDQVNFETALFKGLPSDNGLFMPIQIPKLPKSFFHEIDHYSFVEIAQLVSRTLLAEEIPGQELDKLVANAMNFEVPLKKVEDNTYCLELFHGPSLAFKDFGARFMAQMMSWFLSKKNNEIHILVATSGDTGSAVAQGFYNTPGIKVTILYPSGKVSPTQEKQLTTLGGNITALEVDGVFDDCQRLVKEAFLDTELNNKINLSSANSINIARLIPQSFYYFEAFARLKEDGLPVVFSTPSGNYGNLSGGFIAAQMGLPVHRFIAASNANDIVPSYLQSGEFDPKPSIQTISNAMDVGNPSNFPRLLALNEDKYNTISKNLSGFSVSDDETNDTIQRVYESQKYLMCPHTAVAYRALQNFRQQQSEPFNGVFLGTAHPAKFSEVVSAAIHDDVSLPQSLLDANEKEKVAIKMDSRFASFKEYLLSVSST